MSKHSTLLISSDEVQVTYTQWANFSYRRPRCLQAVKLGRYNSCVHDDIHFAGIHWPFVKLSAKILCTGNGKLTVVQVLMTVTGASPVEYNRFSSDYSQHYTGVRVGYFNVNPSFHPTDVWWNQLLTQKFPIPMVELGFSCIIVTFCSRPVAQNATITLKITSSALDETDLQLLVAWIVSYLIPSTLAAGCYSWRIDQLVLVGKSWRNYIFYG